MFWHGYPRRLPNLKSKGDNGKQSAPAGLPMPLGGRFLTEHKEELMSYLYRGTDMRHPSALNQAAKGRGISGSFPA